MFVTAVGATAFFEIMTTPTLEEVQKDKIASGIDIMALSAIVKNLREFIHNPCGEDRSSYRVDLMKWESHLAQARFLDGRIKEIELKLLADS